jgi:hypothetical protein
MTPSLSSFSTVVRTAFVLSLLRSPFLLGPLMLQRPMDTLRAMMYTGSVQRLTGIAQQEFSTRLRSGAVATHGLSWRSPFLWPTKTRSWYRLDALGRVFHAVVELKHSVESGNTPESDRVSDHIGGTARLVSVRSRAQHEGTAIPVMLATSCASLSGPAHE